MSNGTDQYSESDSTIVEYEENTPPICDAGNNAEYTIYHDGDKSTSDITIILDGSSSFDGDGDGLEYRWSGPDGLVIEQDLDGDGVVQVELSNSYGNESKYYEFILEVTDDYGDHTQDTLIVTLHPEENTPPICDAGNNAEYTIYHDGDKSTSDITIILDGSSSFDGDGDGLEYRWSGPDGLVIEQDLDGDGVVQVELSNSYGNESKYYEFILEVTDDYGDHTQDRIDITVHPEENMNPMISSILFQFQPNLDSIRILPFLTITDEDTTDIPKLKTNLIVEKLMEFDNTSKYTNIVTDPYDSTIVAETFTSYETAYFDTTFTQYYIPKFDFRNKDINLNKKIQPGDTLLLTIYSNTNMYDANAISQVLRTVRNQITKSNLRNYLNVNSINNYIINNNSINFTFVIKKLSIYNKIISLNYKNNIDQNLVFPELKFDWTLNNISHIKYEIRSNNFVGFNSTHFLNINKGAIKFNFEEERNYESVVQNNLELPLTKVSVYNNIFKKGDSFTFSLDAPLNWSKQNSKMNIDGFEIIISRRNMFSRFINKLPLLKNTIEGNKLTFTLLEDNYNSLQHYDLNNLLFDLQKNNSMIINVNAKVETKYSEHNYNSIKTTNELEIGYPIYKIENPFNAIIGRSRNLASEIHIYTSNHSVIEAGDTIILKLVDNAKWSSKINQIKISDNESRNNKQLSNVISSYKGISADNTELYLKVINDFADNDTIIISGLEVTDIVNHNPIYLEICNSSLNYSNRDKDNQILFMNVSDFDLDIESDEIYYAHDKKEDFIQVSIEGISENTIFGPSKYGENYYDYLYLTLPKQSGAKWKNIFANLDSCFAHKDSLTLPMMIDTSLSRIFGTSNLLITELDYFTDPSKLLQLNYKLGNIKYLKQLLSKNKILFDEFKEQFNNNNLTEIKIPLVPDLIVNGEPIIALSFEYNDNYTDNIEYRILFKVENSIPQHVSSDNSLRSKEEINYSLLNFDLKSDYGMYSSDQSYIGKLPDLIISQDSISSFGKSAYISINLDDKSPLQFCYDCSDVNNIIFNNLNFSNRIRNKIIKSEPRELVYRLDGVDTYDDIIVSSIPVKIVGISSQTDSSSLLVKYSKTDRHLSPSESYMFEVRNKIYLGSPKVIIDSVNYSYTTNMIKSPIITISDSVSNIIGHGNQKLAIRLNFDNKYLNEIYWHDSVLEIDGVQDISKDGTTLIIDPKCFNTVVDVYEISNLYVYCEAYENDIRKFPESGISIYLDLSFDGDDENSFVKQKMDSIKLYRPKRIDINNDYVYYIGTNGSNYFPSLEIIENSIVKTIERDDIIRITLPENSPLNWKEKQEITTNIDGQSTDIINSIVAKGKEIEIKFDNIPIQDPGFDIEISRLELDTSINCIEIYLGEIIIEYISNKQFHPDKFDFVSDSSFSFVSDHSFSIVELNVSLTPQKYKLLDSEEYGGKEQNNLIKSITFSSNSPKLFNDGDVIKIICPDFDIMSFIELYEMEGYSVDVEEDTISINIEENIESDLILDDIRFRYPNIEKDSLYLNYIITNAYKPTNDERINNIEGRLQFYAGQPQIALTESEIYFVNYDSLSFDFPAIEIIENKYEASFTDNDSLLIFELVHNFPAEWDTSIKNIEFNSNFPFLENEIIYFSAKKLGFKIDTPLFEDEQIELKGLKLTNFDSESYDNWDNSVNYFRVYKLDKNNKKLNYTFSHDFSSSDKKPNIYKRVNISRVNIDWESLRSIEIPEGEGREGVDVDKEIDMGNVIVSYEGVSGEMLKSLPESISLELVTIINDTSSIYVADYSVWHEQIKSSNMGYNDEINIEDIKFNNEIGKNKTSILECNLSSKNRSMCFDNLSILYGAKSSSWNFVHNSINSPEIMINLYFNQLQNKDYLIDSSEKKLLLSVDKLKYDDSGFANKGKSITIKIIDNAKSYSEFTKPDSSHTVKSGINQLGRSIRIDPQTVEFYFEEGATLGNEIQLELPPILSRSDEDVEFWLVMEYKNGEENITYKIPNIVSIKTNILGETETTVKDINDVKPPPKGHFIAGEEPHLEQLKNGDLVVHFKPYYTKKDRDLNSELEMEISELFKECENIFQSIQSKNKDSYTSKYNFEKDFEGKIKKLLDSKKYHMKTEDIKNNRYYYSLALYYYIQENNEKYSSSIRADYREDKYDLIDLSYKYGRTSEEWYINKYAGKDSFLKGEEQIARDNLDYIIQTVLDYSKGSKQNADWFRVFEKLMIETQGNPVKYFRKHLEKVKGNIENLEQIIYNQFGITDKIEKGNTKLKDFLYESPSNISESEDKYLFCLELFFHYTNYLISLEMYDDESAQKYLESIFSLYKEKPIQELNIREILYALLNIRDERFKQIFTKKDKKAGITAFNNYLSDIRKEKISKKLDIKIEEEPILGCSFGLAYTNNNMNSINILSDTDFQYYIEGGKKIFPYDLNEVVTPSLKGGGRYLILPNTMQESDLKAKRNWIVGGGLLVLSIMSLTIN
ncbi:MAG: hypothetical protein H8E71_04140 [Candidatus Marinimicrobia bacterium]|nr:hypothetical protein [Candidatus Neomarinimicrobiota bacterium]